MTDVQKSICYALLTAIFLISATGFQVNGGDASAALCYLGSYVTGAGTVLYVLRAFFFTGGGACGEEAEGQARKRS